MYVTEKKGFIRENDRMEKKEIKPDGYEDIAVPFELFQKHVRKTIGFLAHGNSNLQTSLFRPILRHKKWTFYGT